MVSQESGQISIIWKASFMVFETLTRPSSTSGTTIEQQFWKPIVWHPDDVASPLCSLSCNHHVDEVAIVSIDGTCSCVCLASLSSESRGGIFDEVPLRHGCAYESSPVLAIGRSVGMITAENILTFVWIVRAQLIKVLWWSLSKLTLARQMRWLILSIVAVDYKWFPSYGNWETFSKAVSSISTFGSGAHSFVVG